MTRKQIIVRVTTDIAPKGAVGAALLAAAQKGA
jgi:hypothetical protein